MTSIIKLKCGTCGHVVGDEPSPETRVWAFEQLRGRGTMMPAEEGKTPEFKPLDLKTQMEKAEELARWVHGVKKDADQGD